MFISTLSTREWHLVHQNGKVITWGSIPPSNNVTDDLLGAAYITIKQASTVTDIMGQIGRKLMIAVLGQNDLSLNVSNSIFSNILEYYDIHSCSWSLNR